MLLIQFKCLKPFPVFQGITTRCGGVSRPPYDTLNLSSWIDDDPSAVTRNMERVGLAFGITPFRPVFARQVHGCRVTRVSIATRKSWKLNPEYRVPDSDGLVSSDPGVFIGVLTADCVSVLLYDPVRHICAAVHAGWRGLISGIVPVTMERIMAEFGSNPASVFAGIGPSAGPCCYEVGPDMIEKLASEPCRKYQNFLVHRPVGKPTFDLQSAVAEDLRRSGIQPGHIEVLPFCTICRKDLFFSYRAALGGPTGRFASLIALK